jgi:protein SCO1
MVVMVPKLLLAAALFLAAPQTWAAQRYRTSGLVLRVDKEHQTLLVSHESIPGYMDSMVMPFRLRETKLLEGLQAGMKVEFMLVVDGGSSYAEDVRVLGFESAERDPLQARRLQLLESVLAPSAVKAVAAGQPVPEFTLIDQTRRPVSLSQFAGKVVAITFIYTRCPLPDYCFRLSNNLGHLQKRFADRLGRDLILLSVTMDPQNDSPEVLARYAGIWKANAGWHFLTGSLSDVKRVCGLFGVNSWPDEGFLTHSLHTAIVDRHGKLGANIEGNQFTAEQLGDLVDIQLRDPL